MFSTKIVKRFVELYSVSTFLGSLEFFTGLRKSFYVPRPFLFPRGSSRIFYLVRKLIVGVVFFFWVRTPKISLRAPTHSTITKCKKNMVWGKIVHCKNNWILAGFLLPSLKWTIFQVGPKISRPLRKYNVLNKGFQAALNFLQGFPNTYFFGHFIFSNWFHGSHYFQEHKTLDFP